jgi:hypothetical protein
MVAEAADRGEGEGKGSLAPSRSIRKGAQKRERLFQLASLHRKPFLGPPESRELCANLTPAAMARLRPSDRPRISSRSNSAMAARGFYKRPPPAHVNARLSMAARDQRLSYSRQLTMVSAHRSR